MTNDDTRQFSQIAVFSPAICSTHSSPQGSGYKTMGIQSVSGVGASLRKICFFLPPPRPHIKTVGVLWGRLPHQNLQNALYRVGGGGPPPPTVLL